MAGRVSLVILDNGAASVNVATNRVQLVIGCASAGTVNAPYASNSPTNIFSQFSDGPLSQAAGMVASVGGTPICVRATTNTAGAASAVTTTGGGTSVITVTGTANDTYQMLVTFVTGGTIGVSGIQFTVSYDNGRTVSPVVNLGTANTYLIPNTGLTLNFAAGTILANETVQFGSVEPLFAVAGIQAAINAYLSSIYNNGGGIGSIHIVGGTTATNGASGCAGADMVSIGGYLQSMAANQSVFTRAYISARDAKPPAAFGGTGEAESAWMTAIGTDFQAQSLSKDTTGRTSVCAAYWNMQSPYATALGVAPRYRRSVAYAAAQRQVQIARQRMPSRVRDGALSPITIATQDKTDGFVYHDESVTPGLDTLRGGAGGNFTTTTRIVGKNGIFLQHANLFSPTGSQYGFMPQGLVIDDACSIAYQVGTNEIDEDVRLNPSGGIDPRDAASVQGAIQGAIKQNMTDIGELTASPANPDGCTVFVDQTVNLSQQALPITVTVYRKGYILSETISVGAAPGT
jgi:uncharacterized protein (UPF0333 family)